MQEFVSGRFSRAVKDFWLVQERTAAFSQSAISKSRPVPLANAKVLVTIKYIQN